MELPHSEMRQHYIGQIKVIEAGLKDATSGEVDSALLSQVQKKLDALAEKYQHSEKIGIARYKLYELQALIHYFEGNDGGARDFIEKAIEIRGDSYPRAEKIKKLIVDKGIVGGRGTSTLPLEMQAMIKSMRASSIIMVIVSILSIYFIPWAIFYIILATKLNPKKAPSRPLVKAAAIATLPLCLGLLPIIIDIEFWKMNGRLKEYEERGAKAFASDEGYLAGEPKRKRNKVIAVSILSTVVGLLIVLIIFAIATDSSSSSSTGTSASFLSSETPTPYTSSEYGFVVSFPGFPRTEHSSLDVEGVPVPYTYYSKDMDSADKSYAVQVAQYPLSDFNLSNQERGALDAAINGMSQSTGATLITSSNSEVFLGFPSASATFQVTSEGQSYDMYAVNFIKGNDLYTLITVGESKEAFDAFVDSFRFT